MQTVFQRRAPRAGGKYNRILVDTDIFRVDNLVALTIFQYAILMYARAVGKGIASNNSLVGLHRHIHQRRHHTAYATYLSGVDVCVDTEFLM